MDNYWYNLRMCYQLSESFIGHTEPTASDKWEWSYDYLLELMTGKADAYEDGDIIDIPDVTKFLEEECFNEGIDLPLK